VTDPLPAGVAELAARSAAPRAVELAFRRLADEHPDVFDRLHDGAQPTAAAEALAAVAGASNALARLCIADPDAVSVLETLDQPVLIGGAEAEALARGKRLELLRIAARDLQGLDPLERTGQHLAAMAAAVLEGAVSLTGDGLAVIGMGKLGGRELNYSSDVDILFVADGGAGEERARAVLEIARHAFRVDAALRPDGRAGPLVRSMAGYEAYWERWARPWEFQALMKARAVAGASELGARFEQTAAAEVWSRSLDVDELAELRAMKARAESIVERRGLVGRELKRGPGGIRDIEFAVQLLQLVHGRLDETIRERSTLPALARLAVAGYVDEDDAAVLARAYRFLRTVEHRLQLVEEEQIHAVPADAQARHRLARVLGFEDSPEGGATEAFDRALSSCLREVRAIHERLFFRPLLESFAGAGEPMSSEAVAARLAAFGFAGAARTRAAVEELAGGLTRRSRLMGQLLPLLLDWLSLSPDPDLGLLGLRNLSIRPHHQSVLVTTFRESPEAARRLCLLLGTSRVLTEALEHNPELITSLDDDDALTPLGRDDVAGEAVARVRLRAGVRPGAESTRRQLVRLREEQHVGIAMRDLLGLSDVAVVGSDLTALSEGLIEAAVMSVNPAMAFSVVGMGRLGGDELSYASDLDLVFVVEDDAEPEVADATAETLVRLLRGDSPAERVATVDLGLRPEGAQGRIARDLRGYAAYFERWGQTWERQAMLRARVVAGDRALGARFMDLADAFVWEPPIGNGEVTAIRRMKARIERERIPAHEDPQFHLKLGRGSLADIEWTAQLLQLRHRVANPSTVGALDDLLASGWLDGADHAALSESYRFCEHTRNRWFLVGALPGGASPGDAFPMQPEHLGRLARSLGTTPAALRDDYRRVTRRARRVVDRLFYGISTA
jgi:[glutamine synthetase] adenylyltransferase / [glutamine synthetase]-adenylyl-L-tyrosine phosphorylase